MSRLTSTAVMARRQEPALSLDFFPTPPWATRALCQHVLPLVEDRPLRILTAWEPACGEGHMAVALAEYFLAVEASDIFPYGYGDVGGFLTAGPDAEGLDWIITNPPFNLAALFVQKALANAARGVAMLVRTAFLEGVGRYRDLYTKHPPALIAQFAERVPMHRGRWDPDGTTATAYCWIVWRKGPPVPTRFVWIPKSRNLLTRPDDAIRFNAAAPVPLFEAKP